MGLFEVSEAKKRAKEIRKEGKELRKNLLSAGLEKRFVDSFLDEFLQCVEQACSQQEDYKSARTHMSSCLQIINEILPQMRELAPGVCKEKLQAMLADLPLIYHDCLIRKDDLDYESTLRYMKKKVPDYGDADRLMMQSELENLKAVFDDAILWDAPDFMALAYYMEHERSEQLSDMENSQRNSYIERFYKEQFWDKNSEIIERAGALEQVLRFEEQMLAQ